MGWQKACADNWTLLTLSRRILAGLRLRHTEVLYRHLIREKATFQFFQSIRDVTPVISKSWVTIASDFSAGLTAISRPPTYRCGA
jgi:hypothetical protein